MWWYVIQVAPRNKQIYEEKEIMEIVEFVSPNNQGSTSSHDGTEVAMLVDNQIDHEDDHDDEGSHIDLEEDINDDLDSPYEANESENQVDLHLLNDDEFTGVLDIFIDIFAQQDLQADEYIDD